jgi:hypothetical protein
MRGDAVAEESADSALIQTVIRAVLSAGVMDRC